MASHTLWGRRGVYFLVASLLSIPTMGAGTCYFPNQLEASGNFPCNNNSASGSACCGGGLGTVCLENGLCQLPQGNVVRGACTDDKWGDGCPQYCLGMLFM